MRFFLPLASLMIAIFSIAVDSAHPAAASALCRSGLCRTGQIFSSLNRDGLDAINLAALLQEDPASPMAWCTYAEFLAQHDTDRAGIAFRHAVSLGPRMSPVLLRAASFDFAHHQDGDGLQLSSRILTQSRDFDEIIFPYLLRTGGWNGILPATPDAAAAWLAWLRNHGSGQDLLDAWSWMKQAGLADAKPAAALAWELWQRQSFGDSQTLWADWLGSRRGDYLHPQRLRNRYFQDQPDGSPFDWTLESPGLLQNNGLILNFFGIETNDCAPIHQFTTVSHGRYRFSAEIEATDLPSKEGLYFHLSDPRHPERLNVQTPHFKGTQKRSWISLDFDVPAGTEALEVQLECPRSGRSANPANGSLHIFAVSLAPSK